jgi:hypothetical protein
VRKFVIQGREYDPRSALRASLNVWRRILLDQGVGMKTVIGDVEQIKSSADLMEDPKLQKSWMAYVWAIRLAAGEDVTFEEANDFPLDEFMLVIEDKEEESTEAPKAPADSDPAGSADQ